MLLVPTPAFAGTNTQMTTVENVEPSLSAFANEFHKLDVDANYYDVYKILNKDRISNEVEDPTDELYDVIQSAYNSWEKAKRYKQLLDKIQTEYKSNKNYLRISESEFTYITDLLIIPLADLNYNRISVELSPMNEIKFKMTLNDITLLIITKPFENYAEDPSMVFYSVFIENKSVLNDYKNIDELVEGINQFLQ